MKKINLYYNNAYEWYNEDNYYVIGSIFYKNKLYEKQSLIDLLKKINISELKKFLIELTGFFSFVIDFPDKIILCSDLLRTFPIFYEVKNDYCFISDNIFDYKGIVNEQSKKELLSLLYVTLDETIYKNVKQLENAQILTIYKDGKIKKEKYYEFQNNYEYIDDLYNVFDKTMIKIFKRTITYLNGRTAVIPLSGGNDSRTIAFYLKKLGYKDIITYTYGNKKSKEVEVSKKVAEYLNLKWFFVPYKKRSMRKKYYNKMLQFDFFNYAGRGFLVTILQEWEAMDYLLKNNIIDNNCVILPGYSFDFIYGSHLNENIMKDKVELKEIRDEIYKYNYNFKIVNCNFDNKLLKKFNLEKFDNKILSQIEACNLFEKFDFEERQSKFINNAIRNYDYYGFKWYLPFWDIDIINFWKKVDLNSRFQKKLFLELANYWFDGLMQTVPTYKELSNKKYNGLNRKIHNLIRPFYLYNHNDLNFYYYFKFWDYLKKIYKYRILSYDRFIALDYLKIIDNINKNNILGVNNEN